MSNTNIRKSDRANKGKPPLRYGREKTAVVSQEIPQNVGTIQHQNSGSIQQQQQQLPANQHQQPTNREHVYVETIINNQNSNQSNISDNTRSLVVGSVGRRSSICHNDGSSINSNQSNISDNTRSLVVGSVGRRSSICHNDGSSINSVTSLRRLARLQEAEELNELSREMAERQKKREEAEKERAIRRDEEEFDRRRKLIEMKYRNDPCADDKSYHRSQISNSLRSQSPRSNHSRHTNISSHSHGLMFNQTTRVKEWVNGQQNEIYSAKNANSMISQIDCENNGIAKLTSAITDVLLALKPEAKTHENHRKFNLAKDLPVFNGDLECWPNFIVQFEKSTELCKFNNEENLIRLEKCLKGKAREVVRSLLMCSSNVQEIINTLRLNFGKPQNIIWSMIEQTKKISAPKEYNLSTFLDFTNGIRNLVTTMETLNCSNHLMNPQLLTDFSNKLPFNLKMDWARVMKAKGGDCNLKDFAEWAKEMATTISYVNVNNPETKYEPRSNHRVEKNENRKFTGLTTDEKSESATPLDTKKTMKCLYCQKEDHYIQNCSLFAAINLDHRWTFVTSNQVCISCLRKGHRLVKCRRKRMCGIDACNHRHNELLHRSESHITETPVQEIVNHTCSLSNKVMLRVAPVKLIGPKAEINTYALFDEGSTVTLLDSSIAEQLGLNGPQVPLLYGWTNNISRNEKNSRMVSLQIIGVGPDLELHNINQVRTVDKLSLPYQTLDFHNLSNKYEYLNNVYVRPYDNVRPMILIGQDNSMLTVARQIRHNGNADSPLLSETLLGWVVHGKVNNYNPSNSKNEFSLHLHESHDDEIHSMVKNYFKTEDFGVKIINENIQSKLEKKANEIMCSTICKIENKNRFELGLLWRDPNEELPESRTMALRRLKSIEKKMDQDEAFANQYIKKINEYIANGYIIKLNRDELNIKSPKVWYLPHFAVTNINKPNKIRIVMDAAAKSNGISLNDALLTGPDLLQSLFGILINFRRHKFAFTADIKEMFHQVVIQKKDRVAQRILWRGKRRSSEPDVYEMSAMIFGLKCSPSMAQFVKNYNADQHENEFPHAAEAIKKKHYVDDYLDCCETVEEADELIHEIITVHLRGGFTICNWNSNSSEINSKIPNELLKINEKKDLQLNFSANVDRVLGLWWNVDDDNFCFIVNKLKLNANVLAGKVNPTKRQILTFVMSIYDPCGFVLPYTCKAKILLQDIWRSELGWDDEITGTLVEKWKKWIQNIDDLSKIQIPRCYAVIPFSKNPIIEMHIFCDASEQAFGAVAYLVTKLDGHCCTSLIAAKNRVSPIKTISIPRLELQAAVLGTRLATTIQDQLELNIKCTYFWTDSKTVLCWLRSESKRFKTFVAHRIGEILDSTNVTQWYWIPTKENVADELTRDSLDCDLSMTSRWLCGPKFLKLEKIEWPQENKSHDNATLSNDCTNEFVSFVKTIDELALPVPQRFSRWLRLIRTTAWLLRFKFNLQAKVKRVRTREGELTVDEIENAKLLWHKQVQLQSFHREISVLNNQSMIEKTSHLYQLSPFMDKDGVIRLNSRLQNANIDANAKNPVILDAKHRYTQLLIEHYHINAAHQGVEFVTNELRQKYCIPRIKVAVKRAFYECQKCKNDKAKPSVPKMGLLPKARLESHVRPFTYTGVDYFGPFNVTIGRRKELRYGVIFTCLTIRAIHLELASTLNTDSAIMAIRRMISRRGYPKELFSDNGTNFRAAEKELKKSLQQLDQNQISSEMTIRGIKWNFIPPAAPHMGGSWERLVRSVKTALQVVLKEKNPREEVLQTLFAEVENLINSRPLTDVSVDPNDMCSLTPNNFLIGSTSNIQSPGIFDATKFNMRKQWRISQNLTEMFWKRWLHEYLNTLAIRAKWHQTQNPINLNDIVLIMDEKLPRNEWLIGKVVAIYPGKDGEVRVASVQTKKNTYTRPVVKLCRLDVLQSSEVLHGVENVDNSTINSTNPFELHSRSSYDP